MGGIKSDYSFELNEGHMKWISSMAEKYDIADNDKTLRIVIDYVMEEADLDTVFEEIRCNHCG